MSSTNCAHCGAENPGRFCGVCGLVQPVEPVGQGPAGDDAAGVVSTHDASQPTEVIAPSPYPPVKGGDPAPYLTASYPPSTEHIASPYPSSDLTESYPPPTATPPRRRRAPIALGVCGAIAVAAAAWWFTAGGDAEPVSATPTSTATSGAASTPTPTPTPTATSGVQSPTPTGAVPTATPSVGAPTAAVPVASPTAPPMPAPTGLQPAPSLTPQTIPTPAPAPPSVDAEATALTQLAGHRDADVRGFSRAPRTIVQLASKVPGTKDDRQAADAFGPTEILDEHLRLRERFGDVVLLHPSDMGIKGSDDMWITLYDGQSFAGKPAANAWCARQYPQLSGAGLANRCLARTLR